MRTQRKSARGGKNTLKFEGLADLFTKLEVEAEKIVRRVIEKTEKSSRDIKKGVSDLVDQVRNQGLYSLATEKKEEIRQLAEEVIEKIKKIDINIDSINTSRDKIIRDAKKNIEDLIEKVYSSELFARAKGAAESTKAQFLSILSIPTQNEVSKLSHKITTLESRVNKLTKKAA